MFHRCFHRTKKTLRPCPFNGLLDQVEALPGGKTLFVFTLGGIIISHCLKVKCFLHGIPAIVFPPQAPIFPQSPHIYRKTLWRFQDSGDLYLWIKAQGSISPLALMWQYFLPPATQPLMIRFSNSRFRTPASTSVHKLIFCMASF